MEDRLLRLKEVFEIIPMSRATWYRGVWAGFYPQPKKHGRSSLWRMSDLQKLIIGNQENRTMPALSGIAP
uniref:helix-turn-helix transcriptional regulator n=1 Tax=uncultured Bilophila sp. TaxID=529385 RepID=UPI0025D3B781|nr:AlpA family phage regulatory protein [uncultured Bilophila sp.]